LLIRPLLTWARRHETEGFCREREVDYRYDSMNEDLTFTRVRIRKLLLPMLAEFNPKIIETLANTARLMAEAGEQETSEPTNDAPAETLKLALLRAMPQPDLYSAIRKWLAKKRGNTRGLSLKHIQAVERLVLSRKSGRMVELPGGRSVVRSGGRLVYTDLKVEKRSSEN